MKNQRDAPNIRDDREWTSMDKWTARFSQNRPFLKAYLGAIKMLFKVFSLPGIRESHPWVARNTRTGSCCRSMRS